MEERNHQPDGRILINERIVLKLPLGATTFCVEKGCTNLGHFQVNLSTKSTDGIVKGVVVVASAFLIGLNHSQESTFTIIHSHHAKGYPSLVLWNFSFLPHKLQQADQP
jgi:hypothetical protein